MTARLIDLIDCRFGRLLVELDAGFKNRRAAWLCQCDCGNRTIVSGYELRRGHTMSCGCYRREKLTERILRHGHATRYKTSRTYRIWAGMKKRCTNPRSSVFKYYGGRGITVCERWHDFVNFLADMGEAPFGLSLDRIDVNRDYQPDNCRWASPKEQRANQRPRAAARPKHRAWKEAAE